MKQEIKINQSKPFALVNMVKSSGHRMEKMRTFGGVLVANLDGVTMRVTEIRKSLEEKYAFTQMH